LPQCRRGAQHAAEQELGAAETLRRGVTVDIRRIEQRAAYVEGRLDALLRRGGIRAGEAPHAPAERRHFEAAAAEGRDTVAVDGKMVDIPVADRARRLLARANAIARVETRKRLAMEANNVQ
jgi:hypothetical protein